MQIAFLFSDAFIAFHPKKKSNTNLGSEYEYLPEVPAVQ